MGQNPRSQQARQHRHTDFSRGVQTMDENGLILHLQAIVEPLVVILDGIQDPHNLGAILRTADAAGVHAVVTPKDRSVHLTETVRRIACGGAEGVPFAQVTNLARSIKAMKDLGIWIIGTADQAPTSLYQEKLTGKIGMVLGFEGTGMRRLTRELCDKVVSLPMYGTVESLNVSVATGICLYEVIRQRDFSKK